MLRSFFGNRSDEFFGRFSASFFTVIISRAHTKACNPVDGAFNKKVQHISARTSKMHCPPAKHNDFGQPFPRVPTIVLYSARETDRDRQSERQSASVRERDRVRERGRDCSI